MSSYKVTQRRTPEDSNQAKSVPIVIRARPSQRDLIDRAARLLGKSRSDFILGTACREAESVLVDRRAFLLDDDAYRTFAARLDARPKLNRKLQALLKSKSPQK